jgi:hypothetical protein
MSGEVARQTLWGAAHALMSYRVRRYPRRPVRGRGATLQFVLPSQLEEAP